MNENNNPITPAPMPSTPAKSPARKPPPVDPSNDAIVITDTTGDGSGPK